MRELRDIPQGHVSEAELDAAYIGAAHLRVSGQALLRPSPFRAELADSFGEGADGLIGDPLTLGAQPSPLKGCTLKVHSLKVTPAKRRWLGRGMGDQRRLLMKLPLFLLLCLSLFGQTLHHVTYRVTGPDTYANNPGCLSCFTVETNRPPDASVTIKNDSGGTEQHAINLPWTKEFDAPSGGLLYLSAQKRTASRDGYGHPTKLEVTIYVDGNVIQHAETTEDYGVASASGKVP